MNKKFGVAVIIIAVVIIIFGTDIGISLRDNITTYISANEVSGGSTTVSPYPDSTSLPVVTSSPTPAPTLEPTPVPTQEPLKIVAVGDIMYGRKVGKLLEQKDEGYTYAFSDVKGILNSGDIVFGNLESPMTDSTISLSKEKKIILKCNPKAIEGIKDAGFNILSLANNHMLDYYGQGMLDTVEILDNNDILHSGAGKDITAARKAAIITKNGVTFGLLSYSDMVTYTYAGTPNISYNAGIEKAGAMPRDYETIREDIAALRSEVDLVAVSLHWGIEESFQIPSDQIEFARKLLDDGADMILGHHPHQFQGMEIYKGKPIIYSMGNFLFDQNDPENMESFIIEMEYRDKKLTGLSAIPVRILDKCHVEVQTGEDAKNILEREKELCAKLGTEFNISNDILRFSIDSN